eukprot:3696317-Amphidinium_carterae.1
MPTRTRRQEHVMCCIAQRSGAVGDCMPFQTKTVTYHALCRARGLVVLSMHWKRHATSRSSPAVIPEMVADRTKL